MAAAGQTFVLQMHGAGWGEEAGLCVNARSEARKTQMRPARRKKKQFSSAHTT